MVIELGGGLGDGECSRLLDRLEVSQALELTILLGAGGPPAGLVESLTDRPATDSPRLALYCETPAELDRACAGGVDLWLAAPLVQSAADAAASAAWRWDPSRRAVVVYEEIDSPEQVLDQLAGLARVGWPDAGVCLVADRQGSIGGSSSFGMALSLIRRLGDRPVFFRPAARSLESLGERRGLACQVMLDLGLSGVVLPVPGSAGAPVDLEALEHCLRGVTRRRWAFRRSTAAQAVADLRREIDRIDAAILETLEARMSVVDEVARHKLDEGLSLYQPERWVEIIEGRHEAAERAGLNGDFVVDVMQVVHDHSLRRQLSMLEDSSSADCHTAAFRERKEGSSR